MAHFDNNIKVNDPYTFMFLFIIPHQNLLIAHFDL